MGKIKIKTILTKASNVTIHHFPAIYQNNKILYHDDMCQVIIDLQEHKMIRENEEFRLEMNFIEGKESKNPYVLKQGSGKLFLSLHTYHFHYNEKRLIIDYQVVGSERIQFELELII